MKASPAKSSRLGPPLPPTWVLAAVAVAVVGGAVSFIRLPREIERSPEALTSEAKLNDGVWLPARPQTEEADTALQEQMALLDPTPLFLPTRWNSGGAGFGRVAGEEPLSSFSEFGPWYAFSENDPALSFQLGKDPPARALDVAAELARGATAPLILGRADTTVRPLDARVGWIRITSAADGSEHFAGKLHVPDEPAAAWLENWAPVELVLAMGKSGLIGRPMLLESSGNETVDGLLPKILAHDNRILGVLYPGIYRISVGR